MNSFSLKYLKAIFCCIFCILSLRPTLAQTRAVDSLKNLLKNPTVSDATRSDYLIKIAREMAYVSLPEAQKALQEARPYAIRSKNVVALSDWYVQMANTYYLGGNIDSAVVMAEVAIKLNVAEDNAQGEGIALGTLGTFASEQGKYKEAIAYLERGISLLQTTAKGADQAHTCVLMTILGDTYYRMGLFDEALKHYEAAIALMKKAQLKPIAVNYGATINAMGSIYMAQKNYTDALNYYYLSITALKAEENMLGVGIAYFNCAEVFSATHTLDSAQVYNQRALKIIPEKEYPKGVADALLLAGNLFLQQKNTKAARENTERAKTTYREIGLPVQEGLANQQLGAIATAEGNHAGAATYLQQALALIEPTRSLKELTEVYDALSQNAAARGDYTSAYRFAELYSKTNEQYITQERELRIGNLQIANKTELLQAEAEKQEAQKKTAYTIIVGVGIALALAMTILIVVALFYRRLRRQKAIIEDQRQRLDVANRAIHHDLKNEFQSLGDLLELQKRFTPDLSIKGVLAEVGGRIYTMQNLHAILYLQPDVRQVDNMAVYLAEICEYVSQTFDAQQKVHLTTNFEPLSMPATVAQDVAGFLNEAMTNAYKYATNIAHPEIRVSLKAEEGKYHLQIRDNGPGLRSTIIAPANATSFGMYFLQSRADQLKGTLTCYNDNGAVIEVTFPS